MLIPATKITQTSDERFANALRFRWDAVCPETGAFLAASNGRTKWGDVRYVLILPDASIERRGGIFTPYNWTFRSRLRAYTVAEAIEKANRLLPKLLKKQAAYREAAT